jgi:hypothetical protein
MFDPPASCFPDGEGDGEGHGLARAIAALAPEQAAVVAGLVEALADEPRSLTGLELAGTLRSLDRAHAVLDHLTSAAWSAWDDSMAYVDDGYRTAASWINANLNVRAGAARYQVAIARKLRSGFPHVREWAAAGRLGRVKVELLVKARAEDVAEVFDREEHELVAAVECRTVEAADAYLASWRLEVLERLRQNDRDTPPPPEHELSTLQLSPILDERMMIRGELDAEGAAIVRKAIDDRIDQWFAAGLLANDDRSRQELQAAALIELVQDGTAAANRGAGARPLVLALIDADTLTARAAATYRNWLADLASPEGWPRGHVGLDVPAGGPPAGDETPSPIRPPGVTRRRRRGGATGPGRQAGRGRGRGGGLPARLAPSPSPPGSGVAHQIEEVRSHVASLTRFAETSPRVADRMPFRSELVGADPIDPAVIERLLCSGDLLPVLHRDHTEVLSVGRARRLATPAQRRALLVRSGGTCEWPGCSAPHTWCDAHHLHFWEAGGATDLSNLALVCSHHHKLFHHEGYTGVVRASGLEVRRPDGALIQPTFSGRW